MDQEAFNRWRRQPETEEFFQYLWRCRLYAMEEWAQRRLMHDDPKTAVLNAMQLGGIKVFDSMLTTKHEDIEHFYELTKELFNEFRYPPRRQDDDSQRSGVDPAGTGG